MRGQFGADGLGVRTRRRVDDPRSGAEIDLDARRCFDDLSPDPAFTLRRRRWPTEAERQAKGCGAERFREILDLMLDAARIEIHRPMLSESGSVLDKPGFAVMFLRVRSDKGKTSLVDGFALSLAS